MVKLADIAREAGCSVAVASRALSRDVSQSRTVAKDTAARVVTIARKFGYQSRYERSRHQAAGVIGVFVPENHTTLMLDLLTAIADGANAADTPLHIYPDTNMEAFRHFMHNYGDTNRNLGVVTYYPYQDRLRDVAEFTEIMDNLQRRDGRIVLIHNNAPEDLPLVSVRIDNYHGGKLAGDYLAKLNCRAYFGIVSGDNFYRKDRTRGFLEAMSKIGIATTLFQAQKLDYANPELMNAMENFIRLVDWSLPDPVGIFCDGDQVSSLLINFLLERGIKVGKQVKLVSYNDEYLARMQHPSLTTVRQPFREMGKIAIAKLVNMMKGLPEKSEMLKPELIVRESA